MSDARNMLCADANRGLAAAYPFRCWPNSTWCSTSRPDGSGSMRSPQAAGPRCWRTIGGFHRRPHGGPCRGGQSCGAQRLGDRR